MAGSTTISSALQGTRPCGQRRLPVGADYLGDGRTHVRVWAPCMPRLAVVLEGGASTELARPRTASTRGITAAKRFTAGDLYRLKPVEDERLYPDPASRFQPQGPHGPSEVVDPASFSWTDAEWRGVSLEGQVVYELHVGTFTREGTWAAAAGELPELARVGITIVEVMPVAEFAGPLRLGLRRRRPLRAVAPLRRAGRLPPLRRRGARAPASRVILDVVYNHLGPVGNYLRAFSPAYFTDRYDNEWGDAINFDGDDAGPVREFFVTNAGYWIDEFHLDGLRLDATQQIFDASPEHILAAIGARARRGGRVRSSSSRRTSRRTRGWCGRSTRAATASTRSGTTTSTTARWSRSPAAPRRTTATRAASRRSSSRRRSTATCFRASSTTGSAIGAARRRGGCRRRRSSRFSQNHDQVANSARGLRGHELTSPGRWRAMTALLLLGAGHADAVSGAGVLGLGAVSVLRRLRRRAGRARSATAAASS